MKKHFVIPAKAGIQQFSFTSDARLRGHDRLVPVSLRTFIFTALIFVLGFAAVSSTSGQALTIFDIQYTTDPSGVSPRHGQVVSCLGGIVTHKRTDSRPRLILQDPIIRNPGIQDANCCWGAIQVKDWFYTSFTGVAVGDWVQFTNVTVEDYRGTTFLQYWNSNPNHSTPGFTIISHNNPVPQPLMVGLDEITSPVEDIYDPGCWYVADHEAEKYESMWLKIRDVTVTDKGNGKASDNYTLQSAAEPDDPNYSCWAADYMNDDKAGLYHPYIQIDQHFCTVQGILEQYKNLDDGWDYYQLLTTKTEDFLVVQPADFDDDCDVDLADCSYFAEYWLVDCSADPDLCGGADLTENDFVNIADWAKFASYWLDGVNQQ